jgi:protein involved in polysaccharide export with SLBB domain
VVNIIAQAGGFKKGANQGKIQIVQPATGKSREIAFKELMVAGNNLEITLNAGDVIYVPKSGFSKFGYVLETVAPLGSFLFFGSMIN